MAKKNIVYSVVSTDNKTDEPVDTFVCGTYRKREDAVTACVDYIMERLVLRPDIRYAFMHDVNHNTRREIARAMHMSSSILKRKFAYDLKDGWEMSDKLEKAVRDYLWHEVLGGVYDIGTDMESSIGVASFIFYIQENQLK